MSENFIFKFLKYVDMWVFTNHTLISLSATKIKIMMEIFPYIYLQNLSSLLSFFWKAVTFSIDTNHFSKGTD